MTTDFRALCEELTRELAQGWPRTFDVPDVLDRARAALDAAPSTPAAPLKKRPDFIAGYREGLADGRRIVDAERLEQPSLGDWIVPSVEQAAPVPVRVPVSERLPEAEDCDAEGRCWVWWKNGVRWVLDEWTHHEFRKGPLRDCVSHWLPATALPLPIGEVSNG